MIKKIIIGIAVLVGTAAIGVSAYFIAQYYKKPVINDYTYANLRTIKGDDKTPYIIVNDDYITVFVDTNEERDIKIEYKTNADEVVEKTGKSVKCDDGLISLAVNFERKDETYKIVEFKVIYKDEVIYKAPFSFLVSKKQQEVVVPTIENIDIVPFDSTAEISFKSYVEGKILKDVTYNYTLFKDDKEVDILNAINILNGTITVNKTLLEDGQYKINVKAEGATALGEKVLPFNVDIKSAFRDFNLRVDGIYKFGNKDINFTLSFISEEFTNVEVLEVLGNYKYVIDTINYDKTNFVYTLKCHFTINEVSELIQLGVNGVKLKVGQDAKVISIDNLKLQKEVSFSKPGLLDVNVETSPFYLYDEYTNVNITLLLNSNENIMLKSVNYSFGTVDYNLHFNKGKIVLNISQQAENNGFSILNFVIEYNGMLLTIEVPTNKQEVNYKVINKPKILSINTDTNINDDRKYIEIVFDEEINNFVNIDYRLKDVNDSNNTLESIIALNNITNNTVKIDVTDYFTLFGGKSGSVLAIFEKFQINFKSYDETIRIVVPDNLIRNILTIRSSDVISEVIGLEKVNNELRIRTVFNSRFEKPKNIVVNLTYYNNIGGSVNEIEMDFNMISLNGEYIILDVSSVLENYTGDIKINYITCDNKSLSNFIGVNKIFTLN